VKANLRRSGGLTVAIVIIGLWAVFLRPQSLGGPATYLVIRGNSMEPTYHGGDLVIVREAPSYTTGDIVAYRVPAGEIGAGHVVIHRIAGGDGQAGYLLQGDNNPSVDPWMPRLGDIAGRSWVVIPGAGRLLSTIHQPAVAGALAVAALAIAAFLRGPGRKKPFVPPRTVPAGP
jgi:signal peptidase I